MGEGIEEWERGGIGSKPLARGGVSARGLDPLEDETQAGADLFSGCQVPSIDPNPLDGENCDSGDVKFPPEAVIGGGSDLGPFQHPLA
jgi:hypothetical protein